MRHEFLWVNLIVEVRGHEKQLMNTHIPESFRCPYYRTMSFSDSGIWFYKLLYKINWNLLLNFNISNSCPTNCVHLVVVPGIYSIWRVVSRQHAWRESKFWRFWRNVDCNGKFSSSSRTPIHLSTYISRAYGKAHVKNGCQRDTCYNENGQCAQTIDTILTWNLETTWKGLCDLFEEKENLHFGHL